MTTTLISSGDFPVLNISQIGYSDELSVTRHGPSRRNFFIIHYILKGKGYFNGTCVKAGEGFLIRPGELEEYHADGNDPWEYLWVISPDFDMEKIFNTYGADERGVFEFDYLPAIFELVYKMRRMRKNILSRCEMLSLFLELLSHKERAIATERESAEKMYTDIASRYVKDNIGMQITVNGLSELLGVSRPYLYKLFMSAYGKSPKSYINDVRISCAKSLLKEGELSISEIGATVGYQDVLSFSKFFSSKVGKCPSEYRKNAKK